MSVRDIPSFQRKGWAEVARHRVWAWSRGGRLYAVDLHKDRHRGPFLYDIHVYSLLNLNPSGAVEYTRIREPGDFCEVMQSHASLCGHRAVLQPHSLERDIVVAVGGAGCMSPRSARRQR